MINRINSEKTGYLEKPLKLEEHSPNWCYYKALFGGIKRTIAQKLALCRLSLIQYT